MLNIRETVDRLSVMNKCKSAILELWTPPEKNIEDTVVKEDKWADESIEYLKNLL
jgi:hypothetical protein